ncbi:MAG: redoxin domain-containing protein [Cyanobacteria bacterium Co-bin13]|nr:redoxin domain-containing protein [Cyanobacteria bacterium Co-bin13]
MRVRAPELPQANPWLNTPSPLSLKALRGQVVILDFWTYGCINCLHVLPDLKFLEQTYGPQLVVIGVHTAKFEHESDAASVQAAIARYQISHLVLVDCDRSLWDQYAIKAWPTFVVIDPQGYVVATLAGEGQRPALEALVQRLITARPDGAAADPAGPVFSLPPALPTPLAFPGKVLADPESDTLFIADSGHHRIVITRLDGTLVAVVGSGQAGWRDGDESLAQFSSPQGMALDLQQQRLYLADTGNHRLRQIDLASHQVSTLAGTGTQSRILFPHGGKALETALNSPWDLVQVGKTIYIAMAGSHQIWQMDLAQDTVQTFMGTGAEFCVDGPPEVAAFAQPSGLATDGQHLFVADSETSSIRAIALTTPPQVKTLCGSGDLFEFGDVDGVGNQVRLQHCLGLTQAAGTLWIADTYNHKVKRLDPTTGTCQTLFGQGQAGLQEGAGTAALFSEPAGVTAAHEYLYVADTNNHAIRRLHLPSLAVTTLALPQLCSPQVCWPDFSKS